MRQFLDMLTQDIRFALRHFARTPFTTLTIVLVMALGIGTNSGVFTAMHSWTHRFAPGIPPDDALVRMRGTMGVSRPITYPEFQAYRARPDVFSDVVASASANLLLESGLGTIPGWVTFVSPNYFSVLRVPLARGTGFVPDTGLAAVAPVAILSEEYWRRGFASDPAIVGKTVLVEGKGVMIVGVAPPTFQGVNNAGGVALWMPIATFATMTGRSADVFTSPDSLRFWSFARLAPGVSMDQASGAVAAIFDVAEQRATEKGGMYWSGSMEVAPLLAYNATRSNEGTAVQISAMLGAVGLLVLLITATTGSALFVGSAITRRREVAVRLSLGASRRRVIRQFVTESVLVSLAAAAVGLILLVLIVQVGRASLPGEFDLTPSVPTLVFTTMFAIATGLVFGLSPALHATQLSVSDVLKASAPGGAGSQSKFQRRLVITQIALTQPALVVLAVMSLMFVRDYASPQLGSGRERIAQVTVRAAASLDSGTIGVQRDRFRDALATLPGVEHVVVDNPSESITTGFMPKDGGTPPFRTEVMHPARGYFDAMGIRLLAGREFTADEIANDAHVTIIGSDLAERFWPGENPIGKQLVRAREKGGIDYTIVGVLDAEHGGKSVSDNWTRVYTPAPLYPTSTPRRATDLIVRTAGPATTLEGAVRTLARETMPLATVSVRTLASIDRSRRSEMLQTTGAAAGAAALTLLLASLGLYAVIALAVTQRTREVGLRLAVGARNDQVVALFLRGGLRLALTGMAIGLPITLAGLKTIEVMARFGPASFSPFTTGLAVAVLVLGVAGLATWLPARRAASVDPLISLRAE
jgi:predicted permease